MDQGARHVVVWQLTSLCTYSLRSRELASVADTRSRGCQNGRKAAVTSSHS
jgi:hypothetical protein